MLAFFCKMIVSFLNLKLHIYHTHTHICIYTSSNYPGSSPLLCLFPSLFDIRMAEDEECVGGIHSEL